MIRHNNERSIVQKAFIVFFLLSFFIPLHAATATTTALHSRLSSNPLSPADTSSPRATLRSFLTNINTAIKGWKENSCNPETYRAFRRALETLDLSTTQNDSANAVHIEQVVLLKEILDRLPLPSYNRIPDADEVTEKNITQWTIPDTKIKIVRVEEGTRQGEFLFSATTVQNLSRYFEQIRQQPYKADATAGLYDAVTSGKNTVYRFERQARFRLRPVDTSSPRATLEGFLSSVNRAFSVVMNVNKHHAAMTEPHILAAQEAAEDLFERAVATLDLRDVPEEHRKDVGIESVLMLKEIIDRLPLPPIDDVPDAAMVASQVAARQKNSQQTFQYHWRFPNTEIDIVEISKGKKQGQFLFSAETVRHLKSFYTQIKNNPYRPNTLAAAAPEEFVNPQQTKGFYNFYISTPGILVPHAHFLHGIISNLPDSFNTLYGEQTLWQWLALALCIFVITLASYLAFRCIWLPARTKEKPLRNWIRLLLPIIMMSSITFIVHFLDEDINLTGDVLTIVFGGGKALTILISAWAVFALCKAIAETIIASPHISSESINATIVKLGSSVVGAFLGAVIIIKGGQRLGLDMLPLLAGFGVGGLAVALAAKQTFANIIGSLILLFNKPVKVGDFCRYGDQLGTVEHIGLISTRIRSLERTIITVPNADFSEMHLDNFQLRDQRLFKTTLQLRYETTPEQMRWVLVKLRELLLGHPMVSPEPARVRFTGFGAFSKDIQIFSYLYCQDQNTFLAIQEDLLLRIEDIILEAGSGFAFPSQTLYTTPDDGVDSEQAKQAESAVKQWRSEDELPFPDFSETRREELLDKIKYPPEGSQSEKPLTGPSTPLKKKTNK